MKKRTNFLRELLLLVVLLCIWEGACAQRFSNMATCGEDDDAFPILKATSAQVPMAPHQGDVNADGAINITDATDLIDILLKEETSFFQ